MRANVQHVHRGVFVCLAIGFALLAGSELWFSAQSLGAVAAGQPQARADPPRALSLVLGASALFLPLGIVGTAGLLLTRLWPAAERRQALAAVTCFAVAIVLMLVPAILPGTRVTATLGMFAAAIGIVILAWNETHSRALLVTGAALLALRFPAFAVADAAYVRASGDLAWAPALWWSVAAFAIGAAASLLLAAALASAAMGERRPRPRRGLAPEPDGSP